MRSQKTTVMWRYDEGENLTVFDTKTGEQYTWKNETLTEDIGKCLYYLHEMKHHQKKFNLPGKELMLLEFLLYGMKEPVPDCREECSHPNAPCNC